MKLSVLPVSYFKQIQNKEKSIAEWAREGVELGLDAIDISIILLEKRDASYLKAFRRSIENEGITVAAASTYPDFTNPERSFRKKEFGQLQRDIEDLAAVGTRIIRITSGQAHPSVTRKEGMKWGLEGILGSINTAEKCGIQLVFENHAKPGVWDYPDFDFPTDIFLEFASKLKDTPVKILFDCANPIAFGDDPLMILEKVIDDVVCVHASDTEVRGELKPVIVGTGLVPYQEIFSLLINHSYNGWINIEEASGKGRDGVKKAVDFIRNVWNTKSMEKNNNESISIN